VDKYIINSILDKYTDLIFSKQQTWIRTINQVLRSKLNLIILNWISYESYTFLISKTLNLFIKNWSFVFFVFSSVSFISTLNFIGFAFAWFWSLEPFWLYIYIFIFILFIYIFQIIFNLLHVRDTIQYLNRFQI
jgi:hypothetical protein